MKTPSLLLAMLLVTPAFGGIEVDTAAWGTEPHSVEILIYSSWTRVPHASTHFWRGTELVMDGGDQLWLRINGTDNQVWLLDGFDPTLPGPWTTNNRVQFESTGQLSQLTTTGTVAWMTSNSKAVLAPQGANTGDRATYFIAQILLWIFGLVLMLTFWESVKRRNALV